MPSAQITGEPNLDRNTNGPLRVLSFGLRELITLPQHCELTTLSPTSHLILAKF